MLVDETDQILKLCKQISYHLISYLQDRNKENHEVNLIDEYIVLQELIENFTIYFKSSKYFKYILVLYNFNGNEFSIIEVLNRLNSILSRNIEKHFIIESFDSIISMIFQYQQINGILKSKQDVHVKNAELQFYEQVKELKSNQQLVKNLISELRQHSSKFESRIDELTSYHQAMREKVEKTYIESQARIKDADRLFKDSKNITNFITEYNMRSNDAMQNIQTISNEASQSLAQIKILSAEADSNISGILDIKTKMESATRDIEQLKKESEEIMKKKDEIGRYETQLTELLGKAVGGSLFKSFTLRKEELSTPVIWWTIAMFLSFIFAGVWIYLVTKNFNIPVDSKNPIWWQGTLGSMVKSSPALLLIFYCVIQRNKERLFQEEYAFKASVALTVDAYSQLVGDKVERDKLISQAVEGIYRSPIKTTKLSQNDVNVAVKGIKGVKDTTKQILKHVNKKGKAK